MRTGAAPAAQTPRSLRPCCHPERSACPERSRREGPLLRPQRPLATLGVTVTTHPAAIVGTRDPLVHCSSVSGAAFSVHAPHIERLGMCTHIALHNPPAASRIKVLQRSA